MKKTYKREVFEATEVQVAHESLAILTLGLEGICIEDSLRVHSTRSQGEITSFHIVDGALLFYEINKDTDTQRTTVIYPEGARPGKLLADLESYYGFSGVESIAKNCPLQIRQ